MCCLGALLLSPKPVLLSLACPPLPPAPSFPPLALARPDLARAAGSAACAEPWGERAVPSQVAAGQGAGGAEGGEAAGGCLSWLATANPIREHVPMHGQGAAGSIERRPPGPSFAPAVWSLYCSTVYWL